MLRLASSALSGGVFAALVPIGALILLQPAEYGQFSIVYLTFAFGLSVQYSVLSETWARGRAQAGLDSSWRAFAGMLFTLCALFALAVLAIALSIGDLRPSAALLAGAVLFGVYRNGARYFLVAEGSAGRAAISDVGGSIAFALVLAGALLLLHADPLVAVSAAWLASGLVASLGLRAPSLRFGSGPVIWARRRWRDIRPLLFDSLLMDAGAIGTPFLLAAPLGAASFGVYRAISNVALPVRLLVDPLRPALGRASLSRILGRMPTALVLGGGAVLSLACFAVLEWALPAVPVELGTLSSLTRFALPCAVFVFASLLGTVYYIVCRTNAGGRSILVGRWVQTALVVAAPLLGAALGGLTGAIWGFSISALVSGVVWTVLAFNIKRPLRI